MANTDKQATPHLAEPQAAKPQAAKTQTIGSEIAEDRTVIGGYAYQIICQQSKQVLKRRSSVLSDSDPEDLHQMRIGTRRLRSALTLFADVVEIEDSTSAALSRSVAKVTKSLGKVRDIDVMQQWFVQMLDTTDNEKHPKKQKSGSKNKSVATPFGDSFSSKEFSKKEKKVIKSLLKSLKKKRKKRFSQMESTLSAAAYKQLAKRCKRWIKQPKFSPVAQQPAASYAARKLVGPLAQLLQHPSWEVATSTNVNTAAIGNSQRRVLKRISLKTLNQALEQHGEQLHDLRKQIKNVRYQTEFFRSLYGIHYAAQVRELRQLQSVLGQLQDQLVVSEFLAAELGPDWAEKLPTLYEAFQSSRLDLWKQWQPLQEKYLALHERFKVRESEASAA